MKVTKLLHACLLIEEEGKTILIDPDVFTEQANVLDVDALPQLDYILITHEHQDHASPSLIKKLKEKFPNVVIISNQSVADVLKKEGIEVVTMGTTDILLEEVPHERMFTGEPPLNTMFHIYGKLSHPGDSHHFSKTNDVLALPITAPWGSTTDAVNLALKLQPKIIIPIHDGLWKDEVKAMFYPGMQAFFKEKGIDFKIPEVGKSFEV